jgi:hypothetical protein
LGALRVGDGIVKLEAPDLAMMVVLARLILPRLERITVDAGSWVDALDNLSIPIPYSLPIRHSTA